MLTTTTRKLFEAKPVPDAVERYLEQAAKVNDDPVPLASLLVTANGVKRVLEALPTVQVPDGEVRLLNCDLAERAVPGFEARFPGDTRLREALGAAREIAKTEAADPIGAADLLAGWAATAAAVTRECAGKGFAPQAARGAAKAVGYCLCPLGQSRHKSSLLQWIAEESVVDRAIAAHQGRGRAWEADRAGVVARKKEEDWRRKRVAEWLATQDARMAGGAA